MKKDEDKAVALAEWTVIAPDGTRFTGPSPLKAAMPASRYHLEIDPEAQTRFLQAIESIRAEGAAERDECLSKYGTLDCPACHGSGHIADAQPFIEQIRSDHRQQVIEELANANWKDGDTAKLVNKLRDTAIEFHGAQQLRERIAHEVREAIAADRARLACQEAVELTEYKKRIELGKKIWREDQARIAELAAQIDRFNAQEPVAQVYMNGAGEICVEFIIEETEHLPIGAKLYAAPVPAQAAPQSLLDAAEKACKWTYNDDPDHYYDTQCGNTLAFVEGGLKYNRVKFCPFCAGRITDAAIEAHKKGGAT